MRRSVAFGALALGLMIMASATAQRPGGGFGGGGFGVTPTSLLQIKEVREELKVTEDQAKQISESARELQSKIREKFGNLKDLPDEERRAKFSEMSKESAAESKKLIEGTLSAEQLTRLNQLVLQRQGLLTALENEDTQKAIGLTDDQKDKLKSINEELRTDTRDLLKGGKEGFAKMATVRKEAIEKATNMLTDDQKKKWTEMTGAEFKFPAQQFGGGFGGNRKKGNDN